MVKDSISTLLRIKQIISGETDTPPIAFAKYVNSNEISIKELLESGYIVEHKTTGKDLSQRHVSYYFITSNGYEFLNVIGEN